MSLRNRIDFRFAPSGIGAPVVLAIAIAAIALSGTAVAHSPIGDLDEIHVAQSGQGPEAERCSRFRPTPKQVRVFFERAVVVSGRQEHDLFDHGPCYARGTLSTAFDQWQWEMRDLGTGWLRATNGDVISVGDPAKRIRLEEHDR